MPKLQFFPLTDNDQYYELPPPSSVQQRTTEKAVEQALYSQSVKKAPDPDKLSFAAIHLLWKWEKVMIIGLAKVKIRPGQ